MGMPSMPELLVVLVIIVLLFGAKKIPDLAKGLGKGIKDFKSAVKDDENKDNKEIASTDEKPATPTTTVNATATTSTTEVKKESV